MIRLGAVRFIDWLRLELGLYLWPLEKQNRRNAQNCAIRNPNAVNARHHVDEHLMFSLLNAVTGVSG